MILISKTDILLVPGSQEHNICYRKRHTEFYAVVENYSNVIFTLLRQRRLRLLGHVRRVEDGRIPKDILYGELALGRRTTGRPHLRYNDVCVRYMKAVDIDRISWEGLVTART